MSVLPTECIPTECIPAEAVAVDAQPAPAAGDVSPADMAQLLGAFNEVTGRLQRAHEGLQSEVKRLHGELADANDRLRRSERLAALGEMAAGIAHEIRNPLGSIRLYAAALRDDLHESPEQQSLAIKIGSAVTGLNRVVGDVLDFARRLETRPELVWSTDLFARAIDANAAVLDEARVVATVQGEPHPVWCDASLAGQSLVNVVRNAAEAVLDAGDGWASRCMALRAEPSAGGGISLTVRDTGPGVPEDVIPRMCNPFFTTRHAGTGLGLAIVHRILDAHGGSVTVQNTASDGSCASVELVFPGVGSPSAETTEGASSPDQRGTR